MRCLQVSTQGQGQSSININVFTVIFTAHFSNTRFAGPQPFWMLSIFFFCWLGVLGIMVY